jgi:co-chaperonin GroES (HSP10)
MSERPRRGESEPSPAQPAVRVSRHVQPLGPRVLVRVLEAPARLDSGLYLPESAKDRHAEALLAEVVEVARTQPRTATAAVPTEEDEQVEVDLGENVSGIPLGARVLVGKDRGLAVPWDETLRLVDVRHILAIVDEIPEEAIQ